MQTLNYRTHELVSNNTGSIRILMPVRLHLFMYSLYFSFHSCRIRVEDSGTTSPISKAHREEKKSLRKRSHFTLHLYSYNMLTFIPLCYYTTSVAGALLCSVISFLPVIFIRSYNMHSC